MFFGVSGWPALLCAGWLLCAVVTVVWIHFFAENRDGKGRI